MEIVPFKNWDFMAIIYSIAGSAILMLLMKWLGVFKKINIYVKNKKALQNYIKYTTDECCNLIVVGKRKGFSLADVYVELDLAPSDLMTSKENDERIRSNSFVLLGGPGAGKSTTAKNYIIQNLKNINSLSIPFFIRLKDYSGNKSIVDYLVEKVENFGFTNPIEIVKRSLHNLCVLDGLDEVRPHLRARVCDEINDFYATHFKNSGRLIITCRKEAYRDIPLNLNSILEVRPLSDEQIKQFANLWPLGYPKGRTKDTFFRDLQTNSRIMELVRSPLMLVGGLMHYTEANLGIPEERFEYLQTMAKWLVVDWAKAQGHPLDQYKNVYDRILTSLAFHMHRNELSEMPINSVVEHISNLLPTYGYQKEEAQQILNSITIKTGILEKDGANLFFAQFGLQEFYSSKELSNIFNNDEISKLQLKSPSWWREVILLHTAQQKDPSELLKCLFKTDPLLAIAAVAECPTPSIKMQNEAITVSLNNIDNKNSAISGSLVPFLRKIRDIIEDSFFIELEKRLTGDKEISSIVGISLVIAGTQKAIDVLMKHAEIWEICLNDANYLSSNFENILMDWIQSGSDSNGIKAADLLVKRIAKDRLFQLLAILPSLTQPKKEHISKLLLQEMATYENNNHRFNDNFGHIDTISNLVPNISDIKNFIKDLITTSKTKPRYDRETAMPTILSSFFIKTKKGFCDPKHIMKTFIYRELWIIGKKSIFFWMISACLPLLFLVGNEKQRLVLFLTSIIFCFISFFIGFRNIPYYRDKYLRVFDIYRGYKNLFMVYAKSFLTILFYFLLGGIFSIYSLSFFLQLTIPHININVVSIISVVFILSIFGFINWNIHSIGRKIRKSIPFGLIFPLNINLFFLLIIVSLNYFTLSNIYVMITLGLISMSYLIWLIRLSINLYSSYKKINIAEAEINKLTNYSPIMDN